MYPTLYEMFHDLFGVDWPGLQIVKSFGFFVAIAFLLAGYVFSSEMKRLEADGRLLARVRKIKMGAKPETMAFVIPGIIGFILGFKMVFIVLHFDAFSASPHSVLFSLSGNVIGGLAGAAIALYFKYNEYRKEKAQYPEPTVIDQVIRPYQHVGNMTLYAALFGIIGAKIFHLLENPDQISDTFSSAESFFSGLTMYGGLIVGGAAVIYYAKKKGLTALGTMDASAPALMLAYGIGRIGCQVAGDGDWGIDNLRPQPGWLSWLPDWTWSYTYPNNVIGACHTQATQGMNIPCPTVPDCFSGYCTELINPVWPTPFYESVVCILLFVVLMLLRKKLLNPGMMFSTYLLFNGVERFFIEKIRINTEYHLFNWNITQAEIISSLFIIISIAALWYLPKHREKLKHL